MLMDYSIAFFAILLLLPLFFFILLLSSWDTGFPGIFMQERIGRNAKPFIIYKFRTLAPQTSEKSRIGHWLRRFKLDELPQLFNILKGDMSLVGPRPDVAGYYDELKGEQRLILRLKPGLTSEAGIKYRNEEELLNKQKDPLRYNDQVLFPEKVKMNLDYYYTISFRKDFLILMKTFLILKS